MGEAFYIGSSSIDSASIRRTIFPLAFREDFSRLRDSLIFEKLFSKGFIDYGWIHLILDFVPGVTL